MQINLCTRNLTMAQEISNRHETHARADQVCGECVAQAMRGDRNADVAALAPRTHTLVDRTARQRCAKARLKVWRTRAGVAAHAFVIPQHRGEVRVQGNRSLVAALAANGDRQSCEIDLPTTKRCGLTGANPGPAKQREE